MRVFATAALAAATTVAAFADDATYIDNRSDAASLVKSLYNAVSRHEYARAWDYFGDAKPSKSFEEFEKGYADTDRVAALTGGVSEEGAAGSVYYQVPVAIEAFAKDGSSKVFGGCYTARLSNPQIQGTPFMPMHLEKGSLKPSDGPLSDALPASCGDAPPVEEANSLTDQAKARFAALYSDSCQTLAADAEPGAADPEVAEITYHFSYDTAEEPARQASIFRFTCYMAAYNTVEVYFLGTETEGVQPIAFAEPTLDIRYKDPEERTKLESMTINGYKSSSMVLNSFFDDSDLSLTSFNKWRGIGDISSSGKYIFRDGEFVLVHYEVDPTEDGEVNPEPVLDFDTAP